MYGGSLIKVLVIIGTVSCWTLVPTPLLHLTDNDKDKKSVSINDNKGFITNNLTIGVNLCDLLIGNPIVPLPDSVRHSSSTSYDGEYPTMPSFFKPFAITGYKFVSVLFGVVFFGLSPPALMDLHIFLRYEIVHP